MRRPVLFAVVLLVIPALAQAQAVGSLAALEPRLPVGSSIVVTARDGTIVRGRVRDVSADGLELSIGQAVKRFAEADVALVERRHTDNLLNGTLIGAGVGAGSALAMYLLICAYEADCSAASEVFAVYGAIGGAIGLAVDASVRSLRPIYIGGLETASGPQWSVAPVLSRRSAGAAFSLSF